MIEIVVRRIHDDRSKTDIQRKETLRHSGVPNLEEVEDLKRFHGHQVLGVYLRICQFFPIRFNKVVHPIISAL